LHTNTQHLKGLSITTFGVLVLTPDTLLIRLVGTGDWTLVFWRGVLFAAFICVLIPLRYRRQTLAKVRAIGWMGLAAALFYGISSITFVAALSRTTVANVLIVAATTPLFAALLSRIFLGEATAPRTWLAMAASLAGIALLASENLGGVSFWGDLMALSAAFCLGGLFTVIRRAGSTDLFAAYAIGGLLAAAVSLPWATPFSIPADRVGYLLIMGLFVVPVSFYFLSLGPRFLPAPEVGLLVLLETILGPFWVWLVIGEEPSALALLGGVIVIAALVLNSLAALREGKSRTVPPIQFTVD